MTKIFSELPAEFLRESITAITGDNSVLLSAGGIKLYSSSVASCRYASELTFKPIAVCFLRPQKHVIRFVDKHEYFTLSYFPPAYQHILESFGSKSNVEVSVANHKFEPLTTSLGNIYYPQAQFVFECRKIFSLELILSSEIQNILSEEKKRAIYPGKEVPRMFVGEIVNSWVGMDNQKLIGKK